MTRATKLKVASTLMGLGLVPMMLWFAMLVNAVHELRAGDFDLSDVMFTGVVGMLAYLATLVVGGAGALWSLGLRRDAPDSPRRIARNLAWLVVAVLAVPWMVILGLVAMRAFG
jgi:hypothetical protein